MGIMQDRVFRIRRNLKDAGCGDSVIDEFFELEKATGEPSNTNC